ncbi:hypothetical protein H6501_02675 [Candidatus Woesearchaeota archaeon]|nr:hypothetical protein [Nanoarchaeota archaeon]MCB9370475.1 hypothetical protein [Candidatus Woesearchaeota archaeon]USN43553.1 MAG: hypothetical protein H6500_04120 [Candidatus Woesearchaeota archaeon]
MIILLLTLIDVHTLFILIFHSYLPSLYVFSGATFAFLKGLVFYLPTRDLFSFLDMFISLFVLFLLIGNLWWPIFFLILFYLLYKIVLSFAALALR